MKQCAQCGRSKKPIEFQIWRFNKDKSMPYFAKDCRKCNNENARSLNTLKKQHPLPKAFLLPCECCRKMAHLFHDHARANTEHDAYHRGFLCRNCNVALGGLQDDLPGVLNAVKYLTKGDPEAVQKAIDNLKLWKSSIENTMNLEPLGS